ncbi:hypothetical protein LBMAG56_04160 [Verrucomicrobiota bacterium]|nr:hypothetical protein LBMAG56_04160 [Verrucomicrobiota bacterium]
MRAAMWRRFPNLLCRRLPSRQGVVASEACKISAVHGFRNLRYSRLGNLRYEHGRKLWSGADLIQTPKENRLRGDGADATKRTMLCAYFAALGSRSLTLRKLHSSLW